MKQTLLIGLSALLVLSACGDDSSGQNNNPTIEICANQIDDDGDGYVDCQDTDCFNNPACQATTETLCANQIDDDNDGYTDCQDADCANDPACQAQTEALCNDGLDNDGDNDIDCADSDCAAETYCETTETTCDDSFDNDGDGDVDCADSDCAAESYCETTETTCDDSFDNDGDGDVDCADSDCQGTAACQTQTETLCNDGLDNDGDGDVDCADSDCAAESYCETTETTCDDSFDNDGDGDVDCADSDCQGTAACQTQTEALCNDGLDNDGDGDVDCADSDCAAETYCETTETTCDDSFDNDGDGDVDCADLDCQGTAACPTTEALCNDGLDNDGDGDVDCADSDCAAETYCETTETTCDDSFDNDGDGAVDCADSDCQGTAACPVSCGATGDYVEASETTNNMYESGSTPETSGLTFDPAGSTAVTIGGCIDPTQVTANVADADFYELAISGPGTVRVVLHAPQAPPAALSVVLYDTSGNFLDAASTTTADDAVILGFDVTSAGSLWLAVLQDLPAGSASYAYLATVTQYPYTCTPASGSPDFTEANDGASSVDNDMAILAWTNPLTFAATTSTTDQPEPASITPVSANTYHLVGISADISGQGDDYLDRDTYEFTTGATVGEVAIVLGWPDANAADLDMLLFPAGDFDPAHIVGFATAVGVTNDEVLRAVLQPSTTYWLWVGTYNDTTNPATLPVDYDLTLCTY